MTRDELEFSVSQYLDGTLPADERVALESRLATDAEAREVLDEYRQLSVGLKAIPGFDPLPDVRWDRLAEQISQAVAEQDAARAEEHAATYRIGSGTRRWRAWLGGIAVAASVAVAGIVGWRTMRPAAPQTPGGQPIAINMDGGDVAPLPPRPNAIEIVMAGDEPAPVVNTQPVVVAVVTEPAGDDADPLLRPRYAGVVNRPSRVTIASTLSAAQDVPAAAFPF